jgi:hypothetical protein
MEQDNTQWQAPSVYVPAMPRRLMLWACQQLAGLMLWACQQLAGLITAVAQGPMPACVRQQCITPCLRVSASSASHHQCLAPTPAGGQSISSACFGHMTSLLRSVAPLVMLLEGGYNLKSTAACAESCVRALLGGRSRCCACCRHPCSKQRHCACMLPRHSTTTCQTCLG